MSPNVAAFVKLLSAAAQQSMAVTGIPASFTLAQGGLESTWGTSKLATQANNLFSVKADPSWKGAVFSIPTREFLNGQWTTVNANWRKYATWLDCLNDHALFFKLNPRYAKCWLETTGIGWSQAVAAAGYATDPLYSSKLIATITSNNLTQFDKVQNVP